ncbi:MAG: hypothetical protein BGN88_08625 [Clostridiales bacterium 43-6]|nr:MAG: hypothetical protein BGN88_08625 [Clostridiales bacterium 43-6]
MFVMLFVLILMLSSLPYASASGINGYENEILKTLKTTYQSKEFAFIFPPQYINQIENFLLTKDITKEQFDIVQPLLKESIIEISKDRSISIDTDHVIQLCSLTQQTKKVVFEKISKACSTLNLLITFDGRYFFVTDKATNEPVFTNENIVKMTGKKIIDPYILLSVLLLLTILSGYCIKHIQLKHKQKP